ncbi:acyl-CoA synthetase [Mycobacterium scrofulaceum]|uniref:Acyl-CoA synthetase n=1 Tax=Mycobacterium scrofulaceum TaxID=1783 RepID=A0A1X0KJ28_MYCSC|nr:acyl-CoA synthetase [Mycobacterium scrofulaceum]
MGFTGDHARFRVAGIAVHLLGKPAHTYLLGSGACPNARDLIFRPPGNTWEQARKHSRAAVRSRIGDESTTSCPTAR